MDLSAADIKLLGVIRKRSRFAKAAVIICALKALLLAFVAVWFGVEAYHGSCSVEGNDPMQWLALLLHQARVFLTILLTLNALICGTNCFFIRAQHKTDRLVLKLVDQASGYPTPG
jgi:hypothetical protein